MVWVVWGKVGQEEKREWEQGLLCKMGKDCIKIFLTPKMYFAQNSYVAEKNLSHKLLV